MGRNGYFYCYSKRIHTMSLHVLSLNKASLRLSFEIEKFIIIAKKEMRLFWTYLFFVIT